MFKIHEPLVGAYKPLGTSKIVKVYGYDDGRLFYMKDGRRIKIRLKFRVKSLVVN